MLKIGKLEHAVIMNATRSHLGGGEDCPQGCGYRVEFLDRKVTQVLMEILVRKVWIWWSKTARRITTVLGKIALVREGGQAVMEDGCGCGRWCQKLRRWSFLQPGEALHF
jgi:hypothetical protein